MSVSLAEARSHARAFANGYLSLVEGSMPRAPRRLFPRSAGRGLRDVEVAAQRAPDEIALSGVLVRRAFLEGST